MKCVLPNEQNETLAGALFHQNLEGLLFALGLCKAVAHINRPAKHFTLIHQVYQESGHLGDPVRELGGRRIDNGLVFSAIKYLFGTDWYFLPW